MFDCSDVDFWSPFRSAPIVHPDTTDAFSDVERSGFPNVDTSEHIDQPFDDDAALSKTERLVSPAAQSFRAGKVNVFHLDPFVFDARIVQSIADQAERGRRFDDFASSVHGCISSERYPVIGLYDPQAQPFYSVSFTGNP